MKQGIKNVLLILFALFTICIFAWSMDWFINHFEMVYYPEGRPDVSPTITAEAASKDDENIFKHLDTYYIDGYYIDLVVDKVTDVEYFIIKDYFNSVESITVTVMYNEDGKPYRVDWEDK